MADIELEIKEFFFQCPETGILFRRRKRGAVSSGCVCATRNGKQYVYFNIHGKKYLAHRVLWFVVYGKWPDGHIDHIDGDGLNNSIKNLRDVSLSLNQRNRRIAKNNSSGFPNVYFETRVQKWYGKLSLQNEGQIYTKCFASPEEAAKAVAKLRAKYDYAKEVPNA